MNNNKNSPKIGLALGGGGARGLAHLGVLKVLKKEGIQIDYLAGVSMGAIIGSLYALGLNMEETEKKILKFNSKVKLIGLIDIDWFTNKSVLKGKKPYKFIGNFIDPNAKFTNTTLPFNIIATNFNTGEETILNSGNILEAIKASSCVPGIFQPIKINGEYYIDGGVTNPTPIDTIKNMGADLIIGVDLVVQRNERLENPSFFESLMRSYDIIRAQAIKFKLSKVKNNSIIIKPNIGGLKNSFKFDDMQRFIKAGETAAKQAIPEIKEKINNINKKQS